jgi:hypothetical protein
VQGIDFRANVLVLFPSMSHASDMPDPAEDLGTASAEVPGWLDDATKRLMGHARDAALASGRGACGATEAAREVLLGRRPALPFAMMEDAVAAVVGALAVVPGAAGS